MGDWRETTWGDEITLQYGKAIRGYQDAVGTYRVFGTNGPVGWTDEPLASGPGVILGRKGAYRGVHYSPDPFFVIDTAYYVKPKSSDLNMRWLYYAMIQQELGKIDDGSPIPSTTRAAVYVQEFIVPPLKTQESIVSILGALDDKIELNRQTNETLEALARALFKDWFVDFGPTRTKAEGGAPYLAPELWALFPDALDDEDKPVGWTTEKLGSFFSLDRGLSYKGKHLDESGLPMVNLGCFLGGGHFDESRLKGYSGEYRERHLVKPGTLVIANTDMTQKRVVLGSPHIVEDWFGSSVFLFSHHVYAARPTNIDTGTWNTFFFFQLLQPEFRERAEGFATGTTVLALPKDAVEDLEFTIPSLKLYKAFQSVVDPLLTKKSDHNRENATLTQTRDLLLPKLMSGDIRLRDAERAVEAVL